MGGSPRSCSRRYHKSTCALGVQTRQGPLLRPLLLTSGAIQRISSQKQCRSVCCSASLTSCCDAGKTGHALAQPNAGLVADQHSHFALTVTMRALLSHATANRS